ncbi:hypothetical protein Tco_1099435 [Tanacetum coccineum]
MSWHKWQNVLASFENGGLNIESLKSFNLALLQKWRWRLVTNPNSIWARAGLDLKRCNCSGVWSSIISTYSVLHQRNLLLMSDLSRKVGNGLSIRFWKDPWNDNGTLMSRFNRHVEGSRNEAALDSLISELGEFTLTLVCFLRVPHAPDGSKFSLEALLEDGSILIFLPFLLGSNAYNGSSFGELLGVIKTECTSFLLPCYGAFGDTATMLLFPLMR